MDIKIQNDKNDNQNYRSPWSIKTMTDARIANVIAFPAQTRSTIILCAKKKPEQAAL